MATTPPPTGAVHRFPVRWTRPHGVLSLEHAGHFTGMGVLAPRF
ncbi:hypothetical protein [Kitasatospora sp. NPDC086791]